MGKGDKKSKRGKLFKGSYGVRRQKKTKTASVIKPKEVKEPVKEAVEIKEAKPAPHTSKAAKPAAPKKEAKPKKTETT